MGHILIDECMLTKVVAMDPFKLTRADVSDFLSNMGRTFSPLSPAKMREHLLEEVELMLKALSRGRPSSFENARTKLEALKQRLEAPESAASPSGIDAVASEFFSLVHTQRDLRRMYRDIQHAELVNLLSSALRRFEGLSATRQLSESERARYEEIKMELANVKRDYRRLRRR